MGIQYQGLFARYGGRALVCPKCLGKGVLGKCTFCNGTGRVERTNEELSEELTRKSTVLGLSIDAYDFTEDEIRYRVEKGRIGNYALGYSATHPDTNITVFHPSLIGRSDTDLQEELLTRLAKKKPWYAMFKFSYATTVREAFETECRDFHLARRVIDNEKHPQRPSGTDYPCPIPNCNAPES
jgi:RecJ-like exonuclease